MIDLPDPRGATRIVLLRHTEPADSSIGLCYGSLDVDLSPAGERHAERLALALEGMPITGVVSSPRRRALRTAEAIATRLGITYAVSDDLREVDFGELEGRSYDEIERTHPRLYADWMATPTTVRFPGGECYAELRQRVTNAATGLRRANPAGTTVVVTHGGCVRALLAEALHMPDDAVFVLDQSYGAINVIDWYGDRPIVRLLNGIA